MAAKKKVVKNDEVVDQTAKQAKEANCIPSWVPSRNDYGLLRNVNYIFKEDGFVDWRKMIDDKYLVPFEDRTDETDISKLEDNEILILLNGIKRLAELRGYESVNIKTHPHDGIVTAECHIKWLPNYESEGRLIESSGTADATMENTGGFGYLGAQAGNRAFIRCVRDFLKIEIYGKDEIAPSKNGKKPNSQNNAYKTLEKLCEEKNITFEQVKSKMTSEKHEGAEQWESFKNISKNDALAIIQRIKKGAKQQ